MSFTCKFCYAQVQVYEKICQYSATLYSKWGNWSLHKPSCRKYQMNRLMTKPSKLHVRPPKTRISLGIHPVWTESSLSAWRKLGSLATHWAHSKDSVQMGRMPRLIWVLESSLSAWKKLGSLATHWAHSEDCSDGADAQADLSLRWVHMPFCWLLSCGGSNCVILQHFLGHCAVGWVVMHLNSFGRTILVVLVWPKTRYMLTCYGTTQFS